ncbi:MAG: flavodoxin family protein [Pseudomonadota bacterium]
MKVLAINGSPHNENGCTTKILKPLLAGMEEAGAQTEIVYLGKTQIHHCIGCMSCWTKTPGECVFNDDMGELLQKYIAADLYILATPLYYYNVSGLTKNFMDRMLPLVKLIRPEKRKKLLLVSPAGFPEIGCFESLVHLIRHLAKFENDDYLGEVLRPSAGLLGRDFFHDKTDVYYKNLKLAGKQLIETNKIDEDLHKKLHEQWMTREELRKVFKEIFNIDLDLK